MARFSLIRWSIHIVSAIVLAYYGFVFFEWGQEIIYRFESYSSVQPVKTPIDLSFEGSTKFTYFKECPYAHAENVYLTTGAPELDSSLLKGLDGEIVITDSTGEEVRRSEIFTEQEYGIRYPEKLLLANFQPLAPGKYSIDVQVNSVSESLADQEQRIQVEYWLCGCAKFPGAFSKCIGLFFGFVALVLTLLSTNEASRLWSKLRIRNKGK